MDITTIVINYQTPDLLKAAVESFKSIYPAIPLIIIDNGSTDNSKMVIDQLVDLYPQTSAHFLKKNIYHGPAMDYAAKNLIKSKYIFFLDSDTETHTSGFLETMFASFKNDHIYGVGDTLTVNKRGFKDAKGTTILMTPYMLLNREIYLELPPFIHHGQPTIRNFVEAHQKGYELKQFPVSEYIYHHWRGTANRFGYGLGLKGKMDFILNKFGL